MRRNSITVVLVSNTREPTTIEFSIRELILIAVFFITLIGSAAYSIVNFRNLTAQHQEYQSFTMMLQHNLEDSESLLAQLKEQLEAQEKSLLVIGGKGDTSQVFNVVNSSEISIQDVQLEPQAGGLSLTFSLVNESPLDKLLAGYLMAIAEHESGDFNKYVTFPDIGLEPGKPVSHLDGDTYAIRKYKVVEAPLELKDVPSNYTKLKIIVFDEEGKILIYNRQIIKW